MMATEFNAMDFLRAVTPLRRTLLHPDNDHALRAIGDAIGEMRIEQYPSGSMAWTWRIPNEWQLIESTVRDDVSGELLWDGTAHPLGTVNYSLPYEGILSPTELAPHLHVSADRPNAIPFVYRFYNRDWGFCMPVAARDRILERRRLRVLIRTAERPNSLKVGVATLPGRSEQELLVVSNICHPGIANDSLSGVAAAIELFRHLAQRQQRRFSYRFLFLPETIGSVAYLANHPEVVSRAVGGFFCEMLGNRNTLCLQLSRAATTYWDVVALNTLRESGLPFRTAEFLQSAANDEKVLDSPGVNIPTISLTRYPYAEYHTSDDNESLILPDVLTEASRVICSIFDRVEDDYLPDYTAQGPVCLAEHGLYPDWYRDPALKPAWDGFVKVMYALDRRRSCEELAADLGVAASVVHYWCDAFARKGFLRKLDHIVTR